MCSVKRKQRVTSLFHVRIGRSESIRDLMKRFGVAILQLEDVSPHIVLQAVKQAIRPNTHFFDLLSLHPPTTIEELFQRGTSTPCSRMTWLLQPNEQLLQRYKLGTTVGIEEKWVSIVKIGRESMTIKIRYELIIITHLEGLQNEPMRIRGGIAARNRHDSSCHHLSSSRLFNLFRGSSGLDLKG